MSLNLNTVMLAGHLTRDPQVRMLGNDRSVADFGLAINRRFKGQDGEMKEESTFVDVECWGRTAELVGQYLTKGSPCYLEGRLKLDSWQDKDGGKRQKLKVVAENVQFLGRRPASPAGGDEGAPVAVGTASTASAGSSRPARTAAPSRRVGEASVGYAALPADADGDQPPF